MRRIWSKRRAGIVLTLTALFGAGALASGAFGMALVGGSDTTSTEATSAPADSSTDGTTSTDSTSSTAASATTTAAAAPPSITSDASDYAPGSVVVLTGSNWGAHETVHVSVDDAVGQSWSYSTDVTADDLGGWTAQVQLTSAFISNYTARASGPSGSAATAFTDGNLTLQLATAGNAANGVTGFKWSVNWRQWKGQGNSANTTCDPKDTPSDNVTTYTVNTVDSGGQNGAPNANQIASLRLTSAQATGTFASQYAFDYWSTSATSTTPVDPGCIAGNNGAIPTQLFAHFKASDSTPPVITPVVTPASANGSNGWYTTGNITVSFTVTDPDSAVTTRSAACATDSTTTTVSADGTSPVTCTATSAGGTSSNTQTIRRDTVSPTAALNALPSSTTLSTIDVSGTATDGTSGVAGVKVNGGAASFDAPSFSRLAVPLSCGSNTITAVSTDNAGNVSTTATASVTRVCDTTAPTIAFTQSPDGSGNWFETSPATVHVTATDASGVASLDCKLDGSTVSLSSAGSTSTTRSGDVVASSSGDHVVACQAADSSPAANTAAYADNQTHLKLDVTSPSITPTVTGTLGLNGWYVSDVTVTWTLADPESGIASSTGCGSTTISSDTAGTTVTCSATNGAGVSASNFVSIKRDTTRPVITLRAPGNGCDVPGDHGWCRGTQTAGFTVTDGTSGFAPNGGPSLDFAKSTGTNGAAVLINSGTQTDRAGNVADPIDAGPFKIDSVGPSLATRPAGDSCDVPGLHGWCRGTQTAGFRATDSTSGFDAAGVSPLDFSKSTTTNGGSVTVASGAVTDWAGNTAVSIDSAPFMIDSVAPSLVTRPAGDGCSDPGLHGWCKATQTAGFMAADSTSGLDADGSSSADFTKSTTTNGAAVPIASGPVQDYAGNEASSIDAGPFKIDSVAPSISRNPAADVCSLPGDNGWCRGAQTAGFTATDSTSGFDAAGTSPLGFTKDTTTNGATVSIASGSVQDYAGNEASSIDAGAFKIDSVKPVITLRPAGDGCDVPGDHGWCRGTQTAGFTATDATSGFAASGDLSLDFAQSSGTNGAAVAIASGTKTDLAGNVADAISAGPFMIDSVAPSLAARPAGDSCDVPGLHGWCRGTQAAGFRATDSTSGFDGNRVSPFDFTKGTATNGASVTISSGPVTDWAGNTTASIDSAPFMIDSVAPSLATRPAGDGCSDPGLHGWCKGTQTAGFRATDSTSGFDASGTSPFDFGQSTTTNGGAVTVASGSVSDWAGNTTASIDSAPFMIDSVAPSVSRNLAADACSVPGDNGWCRGTQTAGFTATDAGSGFDESGTSSSDFTKDTTTNGPAVSVASGSVQDYAGNEATSIDAGPFKIDSVKPVITLRSAGNSCDVPGNAGWCRGTQTAGFTASDGTSGLGPSGDHSIDFGKSTGTNDASVLINSGTQTDLAGNVADAIDAGPFKIDSVKPVISLRPAGDSCSLPGNSGWCRGTQTAGFKVEDATSGFDPTGDLVLNFTQSTSTNGSAVKIGSGTQTDRAGNVADEVVAGPYLIDSVAPTIADLGPTPASPNGNNGWYISAVSNMFEASDETSGPSAACVANFALAAGHYRQSKTTTGDGAAKNVTSDGCTDAAGNSVGGRTSASFKIDLTDPTVSCPTPPTFMLSQLPQTISAAVADTPSGPVASSVSGTANNASGGTVSLTGQDLAGRSKTVQCAYHVGSASFAAPVDKAPTMNIAKLGRVVPVKASLTYDGGTVTGTGTVYIGGMSQVDCATGSSTDAIDVYAAAGSSNAGNLFRWDSSGPFWIYNFDTSAFSMKAGNCYRMNIYYGGSVSGGAGSGGALVGYFLMQTTK